jgi:peptidyl-tRNA hydrolase
MKSFQFSCCEVVNGEIVIIEGLLTPITYANDRGEALSKLHDWFIANKCRPYQEVT